MSAVRRLCVPVPEWMLTPAIFQGVLALGGIVVGLLVARQRPPRIVRRGVSDALPFAHSVSYGETVYLSGVTAQADGSPIYEIDSVAEQTKRVLAVIDKRLALAGTDKSKVLQAQVCLGTRRIEG